MSGNDRRDLAGLEHDLAKLNDKIHKMELDGTKKRELGLAYAMRDEYVRRIDRLRDKIGY